MKILHIVKKYPNAMGGDAFVVSNLISQQLKNGHKVVVLTSNCDEIKNKKYVYKFGFKVSVAGIDSLTIARLLSLPLLFIKAFTVIQKEKPNIIHTHSVDMAFFISFAARFYKIPIVHTFHIVTFYDDNQSKFRRKTELFLVKRAKPVIITAPNDYDVKKLKDAGLKNVYLLPNGIDLSFWRKDQNVTKDDIFIFTTVGRLERQKGIEFLLRAAALLKKRGRLGFKIVVVGSGSMDKYLRELATSLEIVDLTDFLGRKDSDETKKIYSYSDVIVFPALYETTPLTLLEAWALCIPTIATNVGILRDSIKTTVTMLVKMQDEHSLADAMEESMLNANKRKRLVDEGFKQVQQYSWDKIGILAESIYMGSVK